MISDQIPLKFTAQKWLRIPVLAVILALLSIPSALQAQVQEKQWNLPRRISSPDVKNAGEAVMVPDQYGQLHMFWSEANPHDGIQTLQYTVFDGQRWQEPVDIRAAAKGLTIESYAADVDEAGMLHLIWIENNAGPVYYATAMAANALSAQVWSEPIQIDVPAYEVNLIVTQGVIHLLYNSFFGAEPGVYYVRSVDAGRSWSQPYWLDPDIPLNDAPAALSFVADRENGLHAVWYYRMLDVEAAPGHWVRYAHSLDGGDQWSAPFTIDVAENEDQPDELRLPNPGLAVSGDQVHVVWAGNSATQREHRYSLDRGMTWTETQRVMGRLLGQAIGDGLVTDINGRIHIFAQLRWPQGIYHAVWQDDHWTTPAMIYLIARSDSAGRDGRFHAHQLRAGIRAGNQLVVTFNDEPGGPLYVMDRTLEDIIPLSAAPTLTATTIPVTSTPNPTPTPFSSAPRDDFTSVDSPGSTPNIGRPIWAGVIPVILLLTAVFILHLIRNRKRFS